MGKQGSTPRSKHVKSAEIPGCGSHRTFMQITIRRGARAWFICDLLSGVRLYSM